MMQRAKLRRRLQFLIVVAEVRLKQSKKNVAGLGKSFKAVMDMVLLKHCLMFPLNSYDH